MRRSTLTLGLGIAALVAVLVAPRLRAIVEARPARPPIEEISVVEQVIVQIEGPAPVPEVLPPRPALQVPPPPAVEAIPMKTGQSPSEWIPELDAPVHTPRVVDVRPPQPPPVPVETWDNCPACGMG